MKTLILAGGSGTPLYPISREHYPEQFIKIFGEGSLIQKAINWSLLFSVPEGYLHRHQ